MYSMSNVYVLLIANLAFLVLVITEIGLSIIGKKVLVCSYAMSMNHLNEPQITRFLIHWMGHFWNAFSESSSAETRESCA